MQPLKMIIPGKYWDSQIYSGRLYLFGQSGDIHTLDWDRLISEWYLDNNLHLALSCAFLRSDYLYDVALKDLVHDPEVKSVIISKFSKLSEANLEVSSRQLEKVTLGQQDNPLPFPHTDSEIYWRNLYVSSMKGVYRTSCNKKTKYPVSTIPQRQWDAPTLALSASYQSLALAAGDEGLYELELNPGHRSSRFENNTLHQLSEKNCTDCNWAYYSIYGSSHTEEGYLAAFRKEKDEYERDFEGIISSKTIFQDLGYSWGVQDKLCQARNGQVRVVRYNPWEKERGSKLKDLGYLKLAPWKGDVVSAGVAVFGVIIECENALVVLPSQGENYTFPGEPVNWRIFPRSKHYENHLHIIYDDRLEILSFNHDYFVDQQEKRSGTQFFVFSGRRRRSTLPQFQEIFSGI